MKNITLIIALAVLSTVNAQNETLNLIYGFDESAIIQIEASESNEIGNAIVMPEIYIKRNYIYYSALIGFEFDKLKLNPAIFAGYILNRGATANARISIKINKRFKAVATYRLKSLNHPTDEIFVGLKFKL